MQSWSGDGVAKAGRMWLSGCAATVLRGGEAEKQRRQHCGNEAGEASGVLCCHGVSHNAELEMRDVVSAEAECLNK